MSTQNLLDPSPSPLMLYQTSFADREQWGEAKPQENAQVSATIFAYVDSALILPSAAGHWLRSVCKYQEKYAMTQISPLQSPKPYGLPTEAIPSGVTFKTIGLSVKRTYTRANWDSYNTESGLWLPCEHLPQTVSVISDYFYWGWQLCLSDMDAQHAMHSGATSPAYVPNFENLNKDKDAVESWAYVAIFERVLVPAEAGNPAWLHLPNERLDPVVLPVGKLYGEVLGRIVGDTVLGQSCPITPVKIAFNRAKDGRLTALSVVE